jgi:hypothetical protein
MLNIKTMINRKKGRSLDKLNQRGRMTVKAETEFKRKNPNET